MGFFEDKTYTDMDWLNRAIEPYDWPELNKFHTIPNKIDIVVEDVLWIIKNEFHTDIQRVIHDHGGYYRQIDNRGMDLHTFLSKLLPKYTAQYIDWKTLQLCQGIDTTFFLSQFKIEMDEIDIDLANNTITGSISIVQPNIAELQVPAAIIDILNGLLYWNSSSMDKDTVARTKEIIDIIGLPDEEKSCIKSKSGATTWLTTKLVKIIKENEWNIKKVALIFKMVQWIRDYIENGNLAALTNFTKLKCMTHKQVAIYSMEEVS